MNEGGEVWNTLIQWLWFPLQAIIVHGTTTPGDQLTIQLKRLASIPIHYNTKQMLKILFSSWLGVGYLCVRVRGGGVGVLIEMPIPTLYNF